MESGAGTQSARSAARVVVCGSINMDLVVRVPRLPAAGETLRGERFATVPGGKGANQAVAAARLGAQANMLGCVGGDLFGTQLRAGLAAAGVETAGVAEVAGESSGIAMIFVMPDGQNSITFIQGANARLGRSWTAAALERIGRFEWLLLQTELPLAANRVAVELARAAGARVLLDAGGQPHLLDRAQLVDVEVFSPNESELEATVGRACPDTAAAVCGARELLEWGPLAVALKRGAEGAIWVDAQQVVAAPAWPVRVVDTTACGDAWTAALAVALAEGKGVREALSFANAAGGLAATREGAQPAMPSRGEVDALVAKGRA